MKRNPGNSGAAILIAVAAALVVMLAVGLLFSLMDGMVTGQLHRENDAQIRLSEASALEALAARVAGSGPLDYGSVVTYELGGVTTVITVRDMETVGPRRAVFSTEGEGIPLVVPSGGTLFAVTTENGLLISAFSGNTLERVGTHRLDHTPSHVSAVAGKWLGADALVLLLDSGHGQLAMVLTREGVRHSTPVSVPGLQSGSVLTFGKTGDHHILTVSDGGNLATVLNLDTGLQTRMISPAGTCPVITPTGEVYGRPAPEGVYTLAPRVNHVLFGDFNRDGREDIAWAGPGSLHCLTSSGLFCGKPAPGSQLMAWGSVEGSMGLGARWALRNGESVWTRLTHGGFGVFEPTGALENPWTGRFFGRRTAMAGMLEGNAVLAAFGGGFLTDLIRGGRITWGDADGSDVDVFTARAGGIEAVYNPLSGDGLAQRVSVRNTMGGYGTSSTYRLLIYDGTPGWRVFFEREAPVSK